MKGRDTGLIRTLIRWGYTMIPVKHGVVRAVYIEPCPCNCKPPCCEKEEKDAEREQAIKA